jgi:SAM-dependent methyltransferase
MPPARGITHHATEFFDDAEAMRLEDTVWWSRGRRAILRTYLSRARDTAPFTRIVEIGCGSGGHLELLAEYGEVTAVEQSEALAKRARSRNVARTVHAGDIADLTLSDRFQMVCLFDVLEHIEDDDAFVKMLEAVAEPGHWLLLSVPACQFLYGPHDELLHHYRRYSRRRLEGLLRRNGYTITKGSYFLFFVFPIAVLSRLAERLRSALGRRPRDVNLGVVPPWANTALIRLLKLEAALARVIPLPIGVWYIALARKA